MFFSRKGIAFESNDGLRNTYAESGGRWTGIFAHLFRIRI